MRVRVLSTCLVLTLCAGPGEATAAGSNDPAREAVELVAPIKRFVQVSARLYRGGQPGAEGFARLRDLGIRTVVSLRTDDEERQLVESLGMKFVHIPVTLHVLGLSGGLPKQAVERFLEVVDDPANGAVFVHCRRGADRTGAFVGLYRMVRQGWDIDRAFDEARDLGMRWWHFSVKGQLESFASLRGAEKVLE